jgi:hypothetical protein
MIATETRGHIIGRDSEANRLRTKLLARPKDALVKRMGLLRGTLSPTGLNGFQQVSTAGLNPVSTDHSTSPTAQDCCVVAD